MVTIREGRLGDLEAVAAFCRGTFRWGDYIPEVFASWVGDGHGRVLVAEQAGAVLGLMHIAWQGAGQAWFEGMRVHPDHRRKGVAVELTQAALAAARAEGVRVARLAIDQDNRPSLSLAERCGFSRVATLHEFECSLPSATAVGPAGPPELPALFSLAMATAPECGWSPGRPPLVGYEWRWCELAPGELERLQAKGALWSHGAAWAAVEVSDWDRSLTVHTPFGGLTAVVDLVGGLIRRAGELGSGRVRVCTPVTPERAAEYGASGWKPTGEAEVIFEQVLMK